MTDIDNDRFELLERRLSEKVTERVRPALFKFYASIGAAVIAVLGFVSWDIVKNIKLEIKNEITDSINEEISSKKAEIIERAIETDVIAKRSKDIMQQVEKQLNDFQPQVENLNGIIEKMEKLSVMSKDLEAIESQELKPLRSSVESLSSQLKTLAGQVDQLNTMTAIINSNGNSVKEQLGTDIKTVISVVDQADKKLAQAQNKKIVFLQFAGATRTQAQSLLKILKEKNYDVSEPDRESGAVGKHEVRYFYTEDITAANSLAQDTASALKIIASGRKTPEINAVSFIDFRGKKPRPGILELWLEIPLTNAVD